MIRRSFEKVHHTICGVQSYGVFLVLGFIQLLGFGEAGTLFVLAIITGIITDIEGLMASIVFTSWKTEVPSLYHAFRFENTR